MPRYFVIMPLPDEAKDRLVSVQPPTLPGMRLVGRQEMHLTLYSLGEIAPRYDGAIRKALASVKMNALTVTIRGVGKFQIEGEPEVLWGGVVDNSCLFALHYSIGCSHGMMLRGECVATILVYVSPELLPAAGCESQGPY